MDNYFEREFPEVPVSVSDTDYLIFLRDDSYYLISGNDYYIDRSNNYLRANPYYRGDSSIYIYNNDSWLLSDAVLSDYGLNDITLIASNYNIISYAHTFGSGVPYVGFYSTSGTDTVLSSISSGTVANGLLSDVTTVLPFVVIGFVGYIGVLKAWNYLYDLLRGA